MSASSPPAPLVSLEALRAAQQVLRGVAVRTPLLPADDVLPETMRVLLDRMKLVTEPSGAVTVAALRSGLVDPAADGDTVCVLSGGNIEWRGLTEVLGGLGG